MTKQLFFSTGMPAASLVTPVIKTRLQPKRERLFFSQLIYIYTFFYIILTYHNINICFLYIYIIVIWRYVEVLICNKYSHFFVFWSSIHFLQVTFSLLRSCRRGLFSKTCHNWPASNVSSKSTWKETNKSLLCPAARVFRSSPQFGVTLVTYELLQRRTVSPALLTRRAFSMSSLSPLDSQPTLSLIYQWNSISASQRLRVVVHVLPSTEKFHKTQNNVHTLSE